MFSHLSLSPYLRDCVMNVNGLLESLELQVTLQDLRKLGLTEEEIEGFIEFDWDSSVSTNLITSLLERNAYDKH